MILSIILGIVVLILSFLYYRQDKTIKDQIDYTNQLEDKIIKTINDLEKYKGTMSDIDSKGGFESDDEVGQIFKGLKDTIDELYNEIKGGESE